jgi:hypothetical protein
MSIPIVSVVREYSAKKAAVAQEHVQVNQAQQRFNELCKTAGIKINRTINSVDSIVLLKVRPKLDSKDAADPMLPGAAMAGERQGDAYIASFLGAEYRHPANPPTMRGGIALDGDTKYPGYKVVEAQEPMNGQWFRYTRLRKMVNGVDRTELQRDSISGPSSRYSVDYEDIVEPNDRKMWIAGTVVRVADRTNGDILATYTRFLRDGGMGATDGTREPWVHASHRELDCPSIQGSTDTLTRYFVDQVLIPKTGE